MMSDESKSDPPIWRWWERPECARGECARGFDFHAMGLARGSHALGKQHARAVAPDRGEVDRGEPDAQAGQEELFG